MLTVAVARFVLALVPEPVVVQVRSLSVQLEGTVLSVTL
jgi:hypothetical protein